MKKIIATFFVGIVLFTGCSDNSKNSNSMSEESLVNESKNSSSEQSSVQSISKDSSSENLSLLIEGIPTDARFQQVSEKYLLDTNGILYEYQYDYETDTFNGKKIMENISSINQRGYEETDWLMDILTKDGVAYTKKSQSDEPHGLVKTITGLKDTKQIVGSNYVLKKDNSLWCYETPKDDPFFEALPYTSEMLTWTLVMENVKEVEATSRSEDVAMIDMENNLYWYNIYQSEPIFMKQDVQEISLNGTMAQTDSTVQYLTTISVENEVTIFSYDLGINEGFYDGDEEQVTGNFLVFSRSQYGDFWIDVNSTIMTAGQNRRTGEEQQREMEPVPLPLKDFIFYLEINSDPYPIALMEYYVHIMLIDSEGIVHTIEVPYVFG